MATGLKKIRQVQQVYVRLTTSLEPADVLFTKSENRVKCLVDIHRHIPSEALKGSSERLNNCSRDFLRVRQLSFAWDYFPYTLLQLADGDFRPPYTKHDVTTLCKRLKKISVGRPLPEEPVHLSQDPNQQSHAHNAKTLTNRVNESISIRLEVN